MNAVKEDFWMRPLHYFAGGNTACGFYSCFEDILPRAERKRMYYLKGGPGVGKSTLMRRVAEAAEKKGLAVTYYHCSSDPDSLDGISLPERGAALMDGTAPHVYDPAVPAARDTLLALGDFLDETALRPHVRDIERVQGDLSARFARCYRYLAAAKEVLCAARSGAEDPAKAYDLAVEWANTLPLRGGAGSIRTLFGAAYTPKGFVQALDPSAFERLTLLDCPFGLHATALMRTLAERSAARGLHAVVLLDPLSPAEVGGVLIPAHGAAFVAQQRPSEAQGDWVDAERVFTLAPASDREYRFDRNAYELLIQRATEQLAAAKVLHDELERFYVGNMDFLKWQGVLDRVLGELELN